MSGLYLIWSGRMPRIVQVLQSLHLCACKLRTNVVQRTKWSSRVLCTVVQRTNSDGTVLWHPNDRLVCRVWGISCTLVQTNGCSDKFARTARKNQFVLQYEIRRVRGISCTLVQTNGCSDKFARTARKNQFVLQYEIRWVSGSFGPTNDEFFLTI